MQRVPIDKVKADTDTMMREVIMGLKNNNKKGNFYNFLYSSF